MLVGPLPGVARETLLSTLREVHMELTNVRGGSHTLADMYNAYIRWANLSARRLRTMTRSQVIEELVLTRRYWLLQSMADQAGIRPVGDLVDCELDERISQLEDAVNELRVRIERWSRPGIFAVPDTTVYIKHPEKLEDWDLRQVVRVREEPIHILIPILVIDELDSLKESKDKHVRWRAGYTLAVLDRVLSNGVGPGRVREEDYSGLTRGEIPRGELTIEVLLDPPGHSRLPINDDELIDRALTTQHLAGREVRFITYDTGQATRARMAGLQPAKLRLPEQDETE